MNSLRRWLYRPKRSDSSLLAQFYFADEDLNQIAAELDSFEGRKDPERCTSLVNQLRACQARVLNVVSQMMDEQVKDFRASRDFRVKFPDDVIQENLAGQLWFGAECLAAGSSIMNREIESACMRPLARALTKNLDSLRNILREQCLRNVHEYTESIKESLIIFDKLFAEFELSYVSAMVPVKTAHEYDLVQEITVLFSETVQRALKIGLLTRDMIDEYDPALMFTIPRLAIVSGVHIFKDGPLNPDNDPWNLSEMFRPFQTLLLKIRELLGILTDEELNTLERALCSQEEPSFLISLEEKKKQNAREERRKSREERRPKNAANMQKKDKEESDDGSMENELTALEIAERLEALALSFETSRKTKATQSNGLSDHEAQQKSSDSSSTSSSSFLSEGEAEDGKFDIDRTSRSENYKNSGEVQLFTDQLHYETNADNHSIKQDVSVVENYSAFPTVSTDPPQNISTIEGGAGETASDANHPASSDSFTENHNNINDTSLEGAAVGRAHFAMNKCDSNDSGLHSEVLSNSDSTFTISSSDSNNHVAIPDVPVSSDTHNAQDPHYPDQYQADQSQHGSSCIELGPRTCNGDSVHSVSIDSSDTVVLDSEKETSSMKLCLTLSDSREQDTSGSEDCNTVSSLNKPQTQMDASATGNHPTFSDPSAGHLMKSNTDGTIPEGSDNLCEVLVPTTGATDGLHNVLNHIQGNSSQDYNTCDSHNGLNYSCEAVEDSDSEHSKSSHRSKDHICDKALPVQGVACNNVPAGSISEVGEVASGKDITLNGAQSFHSHPPASTATCSEDKENNNEVKGCAIYNENAEVICSDMRQTVLPSVLQTNGNEVISPEQVRENEAGMNSTSVSTITAVAASSQTSKTSDSVNPLNTATYSGNTTSNPPMYSSHNGIQNTSTMNISNPPQREPSIPSTKTNYNGVKGSSKPRSLKRGSKIRRRQQGTSSSQGHKSTLPSQAKALMESQLLDNECNHSSETSSYTSDCGDQEEIDLAIKAAENVTRQQVRARFQNSSDMIHRLFVCISGVADQLQTNFAGDLRNILRAVFDMNCSEPVDISAEDKCKDTTPLEAAYRAMSQASRTARRTRGSVNQRQEPPSWVPDEQSNECMSCQVPFTFVRRRHHCRNCGKIFCSRCSSNFVPLPHFGQDKAVRVCNRCFMFHVTPFTARPISQ